MNFETNQQVHVFYGRMKESVTKLGWYVFLDSKLNHIVRDDKADKQAEKHIVAST